MTVTICRSHDIVIRGRIDVVFPMFTPAGEEEWVDDWRPEYLHPDGRETVAGMIFRTRHGAEETLWSCVVWEPEQHHVRYVRVTPAVRMGFVDVTCLPSGDDLTKTTVRYDLTSLSGEGDAALGRLTPEHFTAMIEDWREHLEAALSSRP